MMFWIVFKKGPKYLSLTMTISTGTLRKGTNNQAAEKLAYLALGSNGGEKGETDRREDL